MAGPGAITPPGGVDPDHFAACDFDGDGDVDLADFAAVPRAAGQVDTGSTYTWNAENRLVSVARTYPALAAEPNDPPVKVEFRYDYLGRRIEKRVLPWNPALNGGAGGWDAGSPTKVTRYVWSGWLMLMELDGLRDCGSPASPAECVVRKYTWGLDLAGLNGAPSRGRQGAGLEDAGGIGGLLAAYDAAANRPLWYFYDANGNVGQVVTVISVGGPNYRILPAAQYEYDPYGNRVNEPAANEYEQPLGFSTKPWDPETGLGYWGVRYYRPDVGRWANRDPIEEAGGVNLYAYVMNEPVGNVDEIGLYLSSCRIGSTCPWQQSPMAGQDSQPTAPADESPVSNATCTMRIKRSAICTLTQARPSDYGHEWIEDTNGDTYDFPAGYIDDPCHTYDKGHHVWEWNARPRASGNLPDGTPCVKATCTQIRACLQRQEKAGFGGEPYNFWCRNCIQWVDRALSACCMRRVSPPTRRPGLFEEAVRCAERRADMDRRVRPDGTPCNGKFGKEPPSPR